MTEEVADPARFREAMAEQEWRMRVRLGDELYEALEQEAERRGYVATAKADQMETPVRILKDGLGMGA